MRSLDYLEAFDSMVAVMMRSGSTDQGADESWGYLLDRSGAAPIQLAYVRAEDTFRTGGDAAGNSFGGRLPWYCEVHTTASQDGRIYWTGTDSLGFWRLDLTDGSYLRAVIEAPLPRLTRAEIDSAAARISGSPSADAHARWLRWFRGLDFPEVRPWTEDIDGCHRRDGLGGLGTESLPDAQRRLTRQCQTRPV